MSARRYDWEADLCIVGAGPVGQTIARAFVGTSVRVILLESGTFDPARGSQELSESELGSDDVRPADALTQGRHRGFGGTSALWLYRTEPGPTPDVDLAARAVMPEAVDFERRSGPGGLGWPVTVEDLRTEYAEALRLWTGAADDFSPATFADPLCPPLDIPGSALENRVAHHGPKSVWSYRPDHPLVTAQNVRIHERATALRAEGNAATGEIERVVAALPDGRTVNIRARLVVLACGGVENAQILLESELTMPLAVGNRFDNVGRHLTDHPEFRLGMIPASPEAIAQLGFYDLRRVGGQLVSGFLTLSERLKRSEGLLNLSVALTPYPRGAGTAADRAIRALWAARRGAPTSGVTRELGVLARSPRLALAAVRDRRAPFAEFHGGWSRPGGTAGLSQVELWAVPEQSSSPANLVRLGNRRDALGRRRVEARWVWSQADRDNVRRSCDLISATLAVAGMGPLRPWGTLPSPLPWELSGIHHPMGTTRMSVDPRDGVVDVDLRVHGLDNLYVAGSSVFPTGHGYANPTLTALALAVRLGQHLRERLSVAVEEAR